MWAVTAEPVLVGLVGDDRSITDLPVVQLSWNLVVSGFVDPRP
jgi:hypothetical protein